MHSPRAPTPSNLNGGATEVSGAPSHVRTYRVWKGSNEFLLHGRLIFGPDVKYTLITIFLIVAPIAIFCVFVARKLVEHPYRSGYSIPIIVIVHTVFVLITLLLTAARDPGIVPRNAHAPEPDEYDECGNFYSEQSPQRRLPRTKDVIVNGISIKIKYCDTCKLYRPPRCFHCSVCDNCVERFDHHCPWVGQCIGLRNYRFYYMFIFSTTLLCLNVHGFCWAYVKCIMDSEEISIWKALMKTPASIALIIYTSISVWFVGGLTVFHTYLISENQSTYENYKNHYDRQVNPYNKGIVYNFKEIFCSIIPPSKNNFRSKVTIPKDPSDSSERKGVESLISLMKKTRGDLEFGKPDYDEVYEVQNDSIDGFINEDEVGNCSEFSDISVDLIKMLHTEGGERLVASFLRDNLWERSSRRLDLGNKIVDSIHQVGESKRNTTHSAIDSATHSAIDSATHSATTSATDIAIHSATDIATDTATDSASGSVGSIIRDKFKDVS
ncbi:putative protein S-acyltransferase [Lupinus albus]|uniref:S-acyltransferase n=1 Tax=Lupinus albus TaxID=3870 RepID=A0A6A4NL50_LUPAL|nr:putative protein S-acyltransferase [Lupinus albus]